MVYGGKNADRDSIQKASKLRRNKKMAPIKGGMANYKSFQNFNLMDDPVGRRKKCKAALITSCNEPSLKPGSKARRAYYRDPLVRECRFAAGNRKEGKYASCYKNRTGKHKGKCTKLVKTAVVRFRQKKKKEKKGKF